MYLHTNSTSSLPAASTRNAEDAPVASSTSAGMRMNIDFLNNTADEGELKKEELRSCASILVSLHGRQQVPRGGQGIENYAALLDSLRSESPFYSSPEMEWNQFPMRSFGPQGASSSGSEVDSSEPVSPGSRQAYSPANSQVTLPSLRAFDEEISRSLYQQQSKYPYEPLSKSAASRSPPTLYTTQRASSSPLALFPQPIEPSLPVQPTTSPAVPEFGQLDRRPSYALPHPLHVEHRASDGAVHPYAHQQTHPDTAVQSAFAYDSGRGGNYTHTYSASSMTSNKRLRAPMHSRRTDTPHCNVKYADEQLDYILYWGVDKKIQWKELERMYAFHFRNDKDRGIKRTVQGLQGAYYRSNGWIPKSDEHGNLIFDENDEVVTCGVLKVRDQSCKIGLLGRYPERAIEYDWVEPEDKKKVWAIGKARQLQLARAQLRKEKRRAHCRLGELVTRFDGAPTTM